jgi:hypothetical protein
MLRSAYPPGGTPSTSLIPSKALAVVDVAEAGRENRENAREIRADIGPTSIRVAKLGKRLPRGPPQTKSVIYAALGLPPRGDPLDFPIPPKAPVVVDVAELAHKGPR